MGMMDKHYRKQNTRRAVEALIREVRYCLQSYDDFSFDYSDLPDVEIEGYLSLVFTEGTVIQAVADEIRRHSKETDEWLALQQAKDRKKAKCMACGYIYNPERGDATSDIPPDTPFSRLPKDQMQNNNYWTGKPRPSVTWVCPSCGAGKEKFEMLDAKE